MAAGIKSPCRNNCCLHVTCGSHIGGQEQKHFSPLGTKLYFHVNSLKQLLQSTPDNSNLQEKSKKVRVIGSTKEIVGSKVKNSFYCTMKEMSSEN